MNCPECDHPHSEVIDSRPRTDAKSIRRRRACKKCGARWNTREVRVTEEGITVTEDKAISMLNQIQDVLLSFAVSK